MSQHDHHQYDMEQQRLYVDANELIDSRQAMGGGAEEDIMDDRMMSPLSHESYHVEHDEEREKYLPPPGLYDEHDSILQIANDENNGESYLEDDDDSDEEEKAAPPEDLVHRIFTIVVAGTGFLADSYDLFVINIGMSIGDQLVCICI